MIGVLINTEGLDTEKRPQKKHHGKIGAVLTQAKEPLEALERGTDPPLAPSEGMNGLTYTLTFRL